MNTENSIAWPQRIEIKPVFISTILIEQFHFISNKWPLPTCFYV
jgi:hypothetical protein